MAAEEAGFIRVEFEVFLHDEPYLVIELPSLHYDAARIARHAIVAAFHHRKNEGPGDFKARRYLPNFEPPTQPGSAWLAGVTEKEWEERHHPFYNIKGEVVEP